jgi:hypothetical protein
MMPTLPSQFPNGCRASAAISILRSAWISAIRFAKLVLAGCLLRRFGRNGAFRPIAHPRSALAPACLSHDRLGTAIAGGSRQKDSVQHSLNLNRLKPGTASVAIRPEAWGPLEGNLPFMFPVATDAPWLRSVTHWKKSIEHPSEPAGISGVNGPRLSTISTHRDIPPDAKL